MYKSAMTTTEKTILWMFVAMLVLFTGSCGMFIHTLHNAGGLKAVIIEAGKEVKDIGAQINKDPAK